MGGLGGPRLNQEALRSLACPVEFWAKGLDQDALLATGREAIQICFGGYKDWVPSLGEAPPKPSRFGGDAKAERGPRYYTVAGDETGNDGGTLIGELMAYAAHGTRHQGLFMMWDLTLPEKRESARDFLRNVSGDAIPPLEEPGLLLGFMSQGTEPDPFARRRSINGPAFIYCELCVKRERVENVVDLRRPEIAEAFTRLTTRLPSFALKGPLEGFEQLLPTMLNQELGGGHGFSLAVGKALREQGVSGLVFSSARADTFVKVRDSEVVDSGGWLFVDYRAAKQTDINFVVDSEPWRDWIGRKVSNDEAWVYEGVDLDFSRFGAEKGSWSVSGLADWQEALFEGSFIEPVLEALDPSVLEEMRVVVAALDSRLKSSSLAYHNFAVRLQLAALGGQEAQRMFEQLADQFENTGSLEMAAIVRRFVAASRAR